MSKKPRQGRCAYCGTSGEVTRDHVIPHCLWSEAIPLDIFTIDACRKYNNVEKSGNDVYLRDLLINDPDVL